MLAKFFIFLIKIYRYVVSPVTPPSCRYLPTCSEYAVEAFQRYNLAKAGFLTIKRIMKCNPFGGSGFDPVPLTPDKKEKKHNA